MYFKKEKLENITIKQINSYIIELINLKNISTCNYYDSITKNIILRNIFLKVKMEESILQPVWPMF